MPSNLGATLTIKTNDGTLVPLYPYTTQEQVSDWKTGEIFGPYQLTLTAAGWSDLEQTVSLPGITPNDIPFCLKILIGDIDNMKKQDKAYTLLNPNYGIESLTDQVKFRCTSSAPTIDLTVQVSWTR